MLCEYGIGTGRVFGVVASAKSDGKSLMRPECLHNEREVGTKNRAQCENAFWPCNGESAQMICDEVLAEI